MDSDRQRQRAHFAQQSVEDLSPDRQPAQVCEAARPAHRLAVPLHELRQLRVLPLLRLGRHLGDVTSGARQQPRHVEVSQLDGRFERRAPDVATSDGVVADDVGVAAVADQLSGDVDVAANGGRHQRGVSVVVRYIRFGATLQ